MYLLELLICFSLMHATYLLILTLNLLLATSTLTLHVVVGGGDEGVECDVTDDGDSELTEALRHSMRSHEKHLNDVSTELQNFQSCVATKGWQIDGTTPDDGNCCFWAVSSQLDRLGVAYLTHSQLRRNVVSFTKDLPEVLVYVKIKKQQKNLSNCFIIMHFF